MTALFIDFCRKRSIDPVKIWNAAYPDERPRVTKKELELTKAFADWQGVAYPKQWDSVQIELMIESLHNAKLPSTGNYNIGRTWFIVELS